MELELADQSGPGDLVRLVKGTWSLSFRMEGAEGTKGVVDNRTIRYPGVNPGVDLEEVATGDGVKEQIVLTQRLPAGAEPRWRFPLTLQGLTPRTAADGTIAFVDATGATAVAVPPGWAFDSSAAMTTGAPASAPVGVTLVGTAGAYALDVSVDAAWLGDPARVYPVRIDPTLDAGRQSGHWDAFASSACPDCNYNGGWQWDGANYVNRIGYPAYPGNENYTYLKFDLGPIVGKRIVSGQLRLWTLSKKAPGNRFFLYPVAEAWEDYQISWNTRRNHRPDAIAVVDPPDNNWSYLDMTAWVANWASGAWPSYGLSMDTQGQDGYVRMAAAEHWADGIDPALYVTYNALPGASAPVSPASGATVAIDTPTFVAQAATDPDGDAVSYWFRVTTRADDSGSSTNSGWIPSSTWTAPAGALQDGMSYYWKVWTFDGTDMVSSATMAKFSVNLRLGEQPTSAFDQVGPVRVNLVNGNVVTTTSSPSFATVGGPVGLSYTYNSRAQPAFGLTGTYTANANPLYARLVRRDPQISFNWGEGSPGPSIGDQDFSVTWTGYVTVPYGSNDWFFGAVHDDGVTIKVNNQVVLDTSGVSGTAQYGASVALQQNQTVPIEITYSEIIGSAYIQLWVAGPVNAVVPATWLSPSSPSALPQGWSISADADADLVYNQAVVGDSSIVLLEPSGVPHEYVKKSCCSWAPTLDGDAVVTTTTEAGVGTVYVVHGEDGRQYTFNDKGQLIRVVSASDDRSPAAPVYEWNGTTARLDRIKDPVSGRAVSLVYATDPTQPGPRCPTQLAFDNPPVGMLCQVTYWDGTVTKLYYASEQLARIEDPGGEVTDFGYAGGRLAAVRDPLAADVVGAGQRADDDTARSVLAYDGAGRATSVTLAAPAAGAARPGHAYRYPTATETRLDVAGLAPPSGFARRVITDQAGRVVADDDAAGLRTTREWDATDHLVATTDPAGRKTTTVYDHAGRPVDAYGPAPSSCFSGQLPNTSCSVPRARRAYDEGIRGLAATYWANPSLAGAPVSHATGVGEASGALSRNWGTAAPANVPADGWSARFTGDILLSAAGTYSFRLYADDGVNLYVDDTLVVSDWSDHPPRFSSPGTFSNALAGSRHRIRVDYYENAGGAVIGLYWTPPGATEGLVPGTALAPRYGLSTSSTDADAKQSTTEYARPELGLATASVADPAGAALRSETSYEAPGAGWLRRLTRTLPAGRGTYAASVTNDAPKGHWRLGETAGTTAADSSGNTQAGTYLGGASLAAGGALAGDANPAVALDGSSGRVGLPEGSLQADTVTAEAWFKTTGSGVILGMGNAAYPNSPSEWVPVLYVGSDGKLRGELWNGAVAPMASAAAVNDGRWHHAAVSGGAGTQALYLDGAAVATMAGTINPLSMSVANVGLGSSLSWPAGAGGWSFFPTLLTLPWAIRPGHGAGAVTAGSGD